MSVALAVTAVGLNASASYAYEVEPVAPFWEPNGVVKDIAVYGNSVYVAGEFTGGIAAVNATTGQLRWTANADNEVLSIAVSPDGTRVMAGGNFVTVNGHAHKRLVALNPTTGEVIDSWRPRATGKVFAMEAHGDVLYVGGRFGSLNGSGLKGLGALDIATGARITSFAHYTDNPVSDLAVGAGRLIASGSFTQVDGQPRASIASITLSGYALTSWRPNRICSGCSNYKAIDTDGVNAYVGSSGPGGKFAAFDLVTGQQPWSTVNTDGDVQAVSVGFDGYVYIGGHFSQFVRNSSNPRTQLANINAATGAVGSFAPGMYRHYPGILALTATPDRLYAGGAFSGVRVNGQNNHHAYLASFAS